MGGELKGLGAGYVNSWIEQYTTEPTPCIQNTVPPTNGNTLSNCIVWLVAGLIIGGLAFQKKKAQQ